MNCTLPPAAAAAAAPTGRILTAANFTRPDKFFVLEPVILEFNILGINYNDESEPQRASLTKVPEPR